MDSGSPRNGSESTEANCGMQRLELSGDRGHERDQWRDSFTPAATAGNRRSTYASYSPVLMCRSRASWGEV